MRRVISRDTGIIRSQYLVDAVDRFRSRGVLTGNHPHCLIHHCTVTRPRWSARARAGGRPTPSRAGQSEPLVPSAAQPVPPRHWSQPRAVTPNWTRVPPHVILIFICDNSWLLDWYWWGVSVNGFRARLRWCHFGGGMSGPNKTITPGCLLAWCVRREPFCF